MSRPGGTFLFRRRKEYLCSVAIERIPIEEFLKSAAAGLVLDVRSPGEYNHGHMPGAVNIPLFTDEQRAIVGTAYKQQSREQAIKEGLDFFGPRMRKMVEEVEGLVKDRELTISNTVNCQLPTINPVFLYCWRGGMRSGAVAWLLNLYGFSVQVLSGGYKAYRRHVLEVMAQPFKFSILGGYTGSGKTELLEALKKKGHAVVNLEALASHKGSAFGKIGMPPQPTQEMFENLLAERLQEAYGQSNPSDSNFPLSFTGSIWLEDESQRIGQLNVPGALWNTMRQSPLYFLNIPFEERLKHIAEEYGKHDREELANCITRISKRLGGLDTRNALQALSDGDIKECFRILLHYYDKHYKKGLHARPHLASLLVTVNAPQVSLSNANLLLPSTATI